MSDNHKYVSAIENYLAGVFVPIAAEDLRHGEILCTNDDGQIVAMNAEKLHTGRPVMGITKRAITKGERVRFELGEDSDVAIYGSYVGPLHLRDDA